jgi:hypothetical protein
MECLFENINDTALDALQCETAVFSKFLRPVWKDKSGSYPEALHLFPSGNIAVLLKRHAIFSQRLLADAMNPRCKYAHISWVHASAKR